MSAWLPVGVYILMIFTLSSMASLAPPGDAAHLDKVAHLLEYGVLGALLARVLGRGRRRRTLWVIGVAVIIGGTVGVLDELFQGTQGRMTSAADGVADTLGALLGASVVQSVRSKRIDPSQDT